MVFNFVDVVVMWVFGEVFGVCSAGILDFGDGVSVEVFGVRLFVVVLIVL